MGTVMLTLCPECGDHMPNGTFEHRCPEVVLFFGSRGWTDREAISQRIGELPKGSVVIAGGARGADRIAAEEAHKAGVLVAEVKARWDLYGGAAGRVRNIAMLRMKPTRAVGFHMDNSPGTAHTIQEAGKRGVPCEVVKPSSFGAGRGPGD